MRIRTVLKGHKIIFGTYQKHTLPFDTQKVKLGYEKGRVF